MKMDQDIPDSVQNSSSKDRPEDVNQNRKIVSIEFTDICKEDLCHLVVGIDVEKVDFSKGIQNVVQVFSNEGKQNIEQSNA